MSPGGQEIESEPGAAELQRLERLLDQHGRIEPAEYAILLRSVGRTQPGRLVALGPRLYSFGLEQVFRGSRANGLVDVATVGALVLDAAGLHEPAIARLDQALGMIANDPGPSATLMSARAVYEAFAGRGAAARQSRDLAAERARSAQRAEIERDSAIIEAVLLGTDNANAMADLSERARSSREDPAASSLMVQLTMLQAAKGDIARANEAAADLLDYATGIGHRARQIDAEVAHVALRSRRERAEAPGDLAADAERMMNNHALWKLLVALYRQSVVHGDEDSATEMHRLLVTHYDWLNAAYRNSFEGLAAFRSALLEEGHCVDLQLPQAPTLLSVGNILASAEAVAIGGTFSAAADWLVWLDGELPAHVRSSLEGPSSRARVEGLLWLRVGRRERARELFELAVERSAAREDTIEAELARAQCAAISGDESEQTAATSRLAGLGIDVAPFVDAATRTGERAGLLGDVELTLLEARVLGRLARGLSYREIEAELGLAHRGAAKPLSSVYSKLGVKHRARAAVVAEQLQIA